MNAIGQSGTLHAQEQKVESRIQRRNGHALWRLTLQRLYEKQKRNASQKLPNEACQRQNRGPQDGRRLELSPSLGTAHKPSQEHWSVQEEIRFIKVNKQRCRHWRHAKKQLFTNTNSITRRSTWLWWKQRWKRARRSNRRTTLRWRRLANDVWGLIHFLELLASFFDIICKVHLICVTVVNCLGICGGDV